MITRLAAALALLAASPLAAQDVGGAWKHENGRVSLRIARFGVPDRAGTTALVKTGEFSHGGRSLDNYVQYESADRRVFATAYIYRTTYADAALAAYATKRAIEQRFGASVHLAEESAVPIAGEPRGAIRQVFTGGQHRGDTVVTAAAFARIDGWVVKLRATGPADRRVEVVAALDALIAGVSADIDARVFAAAPLTLALPCPPARATRAKLIKPKSEGSAAIFAALIGGAAVQTSDKTAQPWTSFPDNGATPACIRGTMRVDDLTVDLLQPAGTVEPGIILAAMDDAGTVIAFERQFDGRGYTMKRYAVGEVAVAGTVDRQPGAEQLAGWLTKRDAPETAIYTRTRVDAAGQTEITLDPGMFQ